MKIFLDTETCGLHGPIILIQYAEEDGPIILYDVWLCPVQDTIALIEHFVKNTVVGFNLVFDWFHLVQTYTTLMLFENKSIWPIDHINEYAFNEKMARDTNLCLKPAGCLDLMLEARKGKYQSTMDRKDIKIKRIPTALAQPLADKLNELIVLNDIYFARRKNKKKWFVADIKDNNGKINIDFKTVILKFAPSSALKALAVDALGVEQTYLLSEVGVPNHLNPVEYGYAPFALAPYIPKGKKHPLFPSPQNWQQKWPSVIEYHIDHWKNNEKARQYARDDVTYTRGLYQYFKITDDMLSDDDSVLAVMVANIRWRGYKVDLSKILALKNKAITKLANVPMNYKSSQVCRKYMLEVLDETERLALLIDGNYTTKSQLLEKIATWKIETICPNCKGNYQQIDNGEGKTVEICPECEEGLISSDTPHPAALRAKIILDARRAKKEIEVLDKILFADRFHASAVIIGARSNRMSGADGLNAQGLNHSKDIRSCFTFAWEGEELVGGDFAGSQMAIADAVYSDPQLHRDLLELKICDKCKGNNSEQCPECAGTGKVRAKLYPIFGESLFPGQTYESIVMTKGLKGELDLYDRSKKGVLAMLFGGETYTLSTRVGIPEKDAEEGFQRWIQRYKSWQRTRKQYSDQFCSMRQPDGLGTKVVWSDPADYIESIFGFRRYFTLENDICKALYDLAQRPPKEWSNLRIRVQRRVDKHQTASGATQSALYSAAFALQSANMRAASNHVIQSPEATIVKRLQTRIWSLQPTGIHPFYVKPLNVHDELMCPIAESYCRHDDGSIHSLSENVKDIVDNFIEEYKSFIPLMAIDWGKLDSWADK